MTTPTSSPVPDSADSQTNSPSLSWPGAVAAEGDWAAVPAHYGNPMREQRLLEEGLAAVDLSARGVVTVSGPDRLSWLHSMTTQHLSNLPPFVSTETLVLSPHGHIEFDIHLVDDGERTWMTLDPGKAPALAQWLNRMKFMLRVEVDDVSGDYAVIGEPTRTPTTESERKDRGVIAWVDPWPNLGEDSASYSTVDSDHPGQEWRWRELIVPRSAFEQAFGDRDPAGLWAFDALRIAAWRPGASEVDHRTIPHELDWLRTSTHLHKGCYRGQETVARVHNLGRPPRRLAFVHLDGSEHTLPEAGTPVTVRGNERAVGRLTSVARHYVEGPIGLVVIKRSTASDAELFVGSVAAAQTAIVAP